MTREASDTIRGFYYQFLYATKLLADMLVNGKPETIICEATEDIDVLEEGGRTCIQVKTASRPMSISSESFKKSILNFYMEYCKNQNLLFVLHTNATPGANILNGVKQNTLSLWLTQQKSGWPDNVKALAIVEITKEVVREYALSKRIDLDLSRFDLNFVRKVLLEFNTPESAVYESLIKDTLKKNYSSATLEFIEYVFVNLLYLVIKKSIAPTIEQRYITHHNVSVAVTRPLKELKAACSDLIFKDEFNRVNERIDVLVLKLDDLAATLEPVTLMADIVTNHNLLRPQQMPAAVAHSYEEFTFVKKLAEAAIPPSLILTSKEYFYQAEYALRQIATINPQKRKNDLERLDYGILDIFKQEYESALQSRLNSVQLLLNTHKEIKNNHLNMLASQLPFDFFHKTGLLHHLANTKAEIKWVIDYGG